MKIDENSLGPNQKAWLATQKSLREIYDLNEINEIPDEKSLEEYKQCRVCEFNTTCFQEGVCIDPSSQMCAGSRERK